jgi:hypothetical protein
MSAAFKMARVACSQATKPPADLINPSAIIMLA